MKIREISQLSWLIS